MGRSPRSNTSVEDSDRCALENRNRIRESTAVVVNGPKTAVAVGGNPDRVARHNRVIRLKGVPSESRHSRPCRPNQEGEKKSDRVGVLFIGERFVPSLFQWTKHTEKKEATAPQHDDLPVVDKTGRPRMFQEEAIHGSVQVRSWSRMVRCLFGELPRDRARCRCRFLQSPRNGTSVRLTPNKPPRHHGALSGTELSCRHTLGPAWRARCLDGAASLHKLGVGASVHTNDLGGNGDADGAALFLQLGDRC